MEAITDKISGGDGGLCPSLSAKQRFIGFGITFGVGLLLSFYLF